GWSSADHTLTGGSPPRIDAADSDDRQLAALGRIAFQRLAAHAKDAEIRIGLFLDQNEAALAAEGTGRSLLLKRQFGSDCTQFAQDTHFCFSLRLSPHPDNMIKDRVNVVAMVGHDAVDGLLRRHDAGSLSH